MRLYYFKPKSYGEEALVTANSLEDAHKALRKSAKEIDGQSKWTSRSKTAEEMIAQDGYTIEVHEPLSVIWTEVS